MSAHRPQRRGSGSLTSPLASSVPIQPRSPGETTIDGPHRGPVAPEVVLPQPIPLPSPADQKLQLLDTATGRRLLTAAPPLQTRIVESLKGFSASELHETTSHAPIFFDARWFALLECLELRELIGGTATLRYVVVRCEATGSVLALCPFLICRDPNVYFFYSLSKYFFLHWPVEAARLAPEKSRLFARFGTLTRAYRNLARRAGVRTDAWVLAVSPLSHRGGIALHPELASSNRCEAVMQAVIRALKNVAREEQLPLCFFGVEQDEHPLRQELRQADFAEVFLVYDHLLPLDGIQSLDDYLGRFRSDGRRLFRREIRASQKAGVQFQITRDLERVASDLAQLYSSTYSRYGEEHFHHPTRFWTALAEQLGPHAQALVAYRDRRPVGFSLLLSKGDLWFYRVGRRYAAEDSGGVYFNLAFYEPIRYAVESGLKRLWLGAGASEAKHRRGAQGYALYSYFWFPRRWDRWLLMPYLENFAQVSRLTMSSVARPSSYLRRQSDAAFTRS